MVSRVIEIPVNSSWISQYAEESCIGGGSHARKGGDRQRRLKEDQRIAMAGNLALSLYLTGNPSGFWLSRWHVNVDKYRGDGGSDFPGSNIDIKASRLSKKRLWSDHRLIVDPNEYKPDTLYILALADKTPSGYAVYLIGYSLGRDLTFGKLGKWGDKHYLRASDLEGMMPINWMYSPSEISCIPSSDLNGLCCQ